MIKALEFTYLSSSLDRLFIEREEMLAYCSVFSDYCGSSLGEELDYIDESIREVLSEYSAYVSNLDKLDYQDTLA